MNARNETKFSIVLPVLNQVEYIEAAIQSVVSQDYSALELLVIDGGSTDGTLEIIDRFSRAIDYFISQKDLCQNHALNRGFLRASGDFIGWLNADDTYEKDAFSRVDAHLTRHPEADLIYGEAGIINERGQLVKLYGARPYDAYTLFCRRDFIPTQSCFFRRDCLSLVGLLDTTLRWNGDWDLWRRIAKHFNIVFLPEHLGNWRQRHGTISFGPQVDYFAKHLETIRSVRTHSSRLVTPIEVRLWPWLLIDGLHLRPILRSVRDWMRKVLTLLSSFPELS